MAETETLEQEQVETQAEETPQVEEQGTDDGFLDVLYTDLGVDIEPPPVEEAEPEPEAEPEEVQAEVKAEDSEPEPEKEEAKPKKKFSVKQELSKDDIRQTIKDEIARHKPSLPEQPVQQPIQEPEVEEDDLDNYDYLPEQRDEIELARYAEQVDPKKYKGMANDLQQFYADLDEYVDKNDDPDRTFDENDEEFIKWIQRNKPSLSNAEQRKLERQMIKDQAISEAKSEFEKKQNELEDKIRKVEDRPKAEKEFTKYESLLDGDKPEEDELAESIYQQEMDTAKKVGREYLDLFYGLKTFEQEDPLHSWIIDFVTQQSDAFQQHGGEHLTRDNKAFVPPSEYANADPNKHWTFTSSDVMEIMGNYFSTRAKDSVKIEEERLNKLGFTRQTKNKSQTKAKKEEVKPTRTPKATNSPSPGAAPNSDGVEEQDSPGQDILNRLGIDF